MSGINVPPGFAWHYAGLTGLLVPLSVSEAPKTEKLAAEDVAETDSEKDSVVAATPPDEASASGQDTSLGDPPPSGVPQTQGPEDDTAGVANCAQHLVFQAAQLDAMEARLYLVRDSDEKLRITRILKQLRARTPLRRVSALAQAEHLAALAAAQPHFAHVVDFVIEQLALARHVGQAARIPPILLLSEPGLGKTHFVHRLALALGAICTTVCYDTGVSSASLLGLDRMWGNSVHGLLFDRICLGEWANPLFMLEEIDKAPTKSNDDPLSALHTLLEPSTAGAVTDVSLEFTFDASLVTWIATANDPSRIPSTLRSRFHEFFIAFPSAPQAIEIARGVIAATLAEHAPPGFEPAPRHFAPDLAHCTAREIRKAVVTAIARAVSNGRTCMLRADLPADVLWESNGDGTTWLH